MNEPDEPLTLLSVFHYVLGGFTALFACIPFLHIALGIAMLTGGLETEGAEEFPAILGILFIVIPSIFVLAGWAMAGCMIVAGRKLAARTGRTFCLVTAGLECMLFPFGTALGVVTLVVLMKDEVAARFRSA